MENNNIFKKLMEVRVKFHQLELKKTGINKFAGFKYFELADFLVPATQILNEYNLCTFINFTNELATMTLVNADNPSETIEFTSPVRELKLKGTNEIQNLGGIQTYLTRYLYIQLLNIVESDSFDAVSGKQVLTNEQINEMYTKGSKLGYNKFTVDKMIKQKYDKETIYMTKEEYDNVIDGFNKLLAKK